MAVTLSEIAKKVGMAKTTVATVLSNKSDQFGIADKTREKIQKVALEMGYRPSFLARSLARGKTFSLGFICGDINTPAVSELAAIGMEEAEKRGYHLLISVTQWDYQRELDCLGMLLERRVDGVMMVSAALWPGTAQYEQIIQNQFPIVILHEQCPENLAFVGNDWVPGMLQAVQHLKGKGHRRICFLGQENPDKKPYGKHSAFLDACRREAIDFLEFECSVSIESARRMGHVVAECSDRPSAVIAYSDYISSGFILGLHESGLRVPEDMAVVGIDGTDFGRYFLPPLTSIGVDRRRIMVQTLELLLKMMDKKEILAEKSYLPTSLIIRAST